MSILDAGKIDSISRVKNSNAIRLNIYDHIEWGGEYDENHIDLLIEKVNSYFKFIKEGSLFDLIPEAIDMELEIVVVGKFKPNAYGEAFYSEAIYISKKNGLKLSFVLSEFPEKDEGGVDGDQNKER